MTILETNKPGQVDLKAFDTLKKVNKVALIIIAVILFAVSWRLAANYNLNNELEGRNLANLKRNVIVVHPKQGESSKKLVLPASLRGNTETQIYARTNGYINKWYKNIGEQVKKGELLATIDVPELEHELAQGRSTVTQIKARLDLARSTLKRWSLLTGTDAAHPQELDEKQAAVLQAESDYSAAQSNVKRLENIENYRRIIAPFDGVITRRSIEVGSLISPGAQELFALSQVDPLRITAWVPQIYANEVKIGQDVSVRLNDNQNKAINAKIDHIAGGLDPINRTRQIDITLPNPDNKLLPGSYAEIAINIINKQSPIVVPANVLIINQTGIHAMVVNNEHNIEVRDLKIGRDFGREVEILEGIAANDILVSSPSDMLESGENVNTFEPSQKQ